MNEVSKRGRPQGKKNAITQDLVVDLRDLLIQCAQEIINYNHSSAYEVLKKIKQHCNQHGDSTEGLAHYFVMAVEARLAGTGAEVYREASLKKISRAHILKAYHSYLMVCPFHRMSFVFETWWPTHAPDYWYKPSTTEVPPSRVEETDGNELTVVNSVKRLRNILDEMVIESSPRDTVLQLIRQINPDMFVLGILNGAYNAPFLLNRLNTYATNSPLKL
ncbi:scarecrow-like protein 30 [Tanacetum coccineum]|uniref:Scarecrow-like protein 30 n=1 Tax=Tanacetum coccineum TaxID=301880 RepID=A0ABQ5J7T6_9ASTR